MASGDSENNKKFGKRMSFRQELVIYMLGTAGVLLIVLGIVLYGFSRRTIEDNYKTSHEAYMKLFNSSVNIRLDEIIGDARNLLEDASYMEIMEEGGGDSRYFSYKSQNRLERILLNIENDNKYIAGILAVNMEGKFRYVSRPSASLKVNEFYRSGSILSQDYIAAANVAEGKEIIRGYNVLDESDDSIFSIIKQMNNPKTGKCVGYLVISVSKNMIREVFGSNVNVLEDNRYFIIDTALDPSNDNYLVYSRNIGEDELSKMIGAYNSSDESKYLFSSYSSVNSNWDIVSVILRSDLKSQSAYIKWITFGGIIVLIVLCLVISMIISEKINKPLKKLEMTISEVGEGNYRPEVSFDDSEIGKVGQYLLDISGNNLELRDKLLHSELNEREAQLLLLQSQINPHFLYNTLDAIYFMAVIDEVDDIAEMVKALSDYFRLSLNKGDKLITVRDAIDKIRAYMKIENMRYQNRFVLNVDVEDQMLDEKLMSFVLQPIVENAVIHGLERKIGTGQVDIIGYMEDDNLHLTVHDNGVGIDDPAKLDEGYGIRNVRERIRLFYGDEYDIAFESEAGAGTTVFLTLPAGPKLDDNETAVPLEADN